MHAALARPIRRAAEIAASYDWGQSQQPPRRADPADAITVWSCKFGLPRRRKKKFVCEASQTNPVCGGRTANCRLHILAGEEKQ